MPALIGPTEICTAEVWSKDPNFMMYCYKVTPCTHRTPHDWRICPWAHPNERAARRCPRMFVYASVPCANARSGRACSKGPACEYSHNVTEYWLHPTRYRAEWCSLGLGCNRRLCFFAHSDVELQTSDWSVAPVMPPPPPMVVQTQPTQVPHLDLLASASEQSQTWVRSMLQQHHLQHHHHLQQQQTQQQLSFGESGLDASASFDDARPQDIVQLRMAAVSPSTAATTNRAGVEVAADPALIRRQQQQQQRQSSVSAVPAFSDLLGAVAPSPPATFFQLGPAMATVGQMYAPGATPPLPVPPNYVLDASSVELIAAILQSLPTV
jgi:hypothetical protein